jgi:hypothetical protein
MEDQERTRENRILLFIARRQWPIAIVKMFPLGAWNYAKLNKIKLKFKNWICVVNEIEFFYKSIMLDLFFFSVVGVVCH